MITLLEVYDRLDKFLKKRKRGIPEIGSIRDELHEYLFKDKMDVYKSFNADRQNYIAPAAENMYAQSCDIKDGFTQPHKEALIADLHYGIMKQYIAKNEKKFKEFVPVDNKLRTWYGVKLYIYTEEEIRDAIYNIMQLVLDERLRLRFQELKAGQTERSTNDE